jgi:cbb3-type cytochrome oxidase maturation protein
MDILLLLIPLSVVLALLIIVVLAWAFANQQFDHLEAEGQRILDADQDATRAGE